MMRKQPTTPPPQVTPKRDETIITQVREYELITPLFGGGVTPNEADPVTPIRGTEIRGHLRFWWRACRGGKVEFNGDLAKMKKAEGELWGTAAKKSAQTTKGDKAQQEVHQPVQISIEAINSGTGIKPFIIVTNQSGRKRAAQNTQPNTPSAYAAFPLQPKEEEVYQQNLKLKEVQSNIRFKLTISFPAHQRLEIEATLWAWETFGGIGARTRRGFGALRCISIKENNQAKTALLSEANLAKAQQWIVDNAKKHVTDGPWPDGVSHLTKNLIEGTHFKLVSFQSNEPIVVWNSLIESLKKFRQKRHPSIRQNARHPGRSEWPEPSAIRQLTNQSHPDHRNPIPNPAINKFPRASFGLPIIFHFKDNGDPVDTTLQGAEHERLASPLILRPLTCQEGKVVGLALILDNPKTLPGGFVLLKKGNPTPQPVNATLTPNEAKRIPPLNGQTDILRAFLDYLTTH